MRSGLRYALVLVMAGACSAGLIDDPSQVGSGSNPGGGSQTGEPKELTTSNKLSLNKLSLNKLSLNKLSLNALSTSTLDGDMASTEDGREVLTYVARCALPEGETLIAETGGETYAFPGSLGLAPEWADGPCTDQCQRWVSACLLAHVNALGVSVPISVRGLHPSLQPVAPAEQAEYPVEEAGFYGDLFVSGAEPMEMYACEGHGIVDFFGQDSPYLDERLCASTNACGFTRMGPCHDIVVTPPGGGTSYAAFPGACLIDLGDALAECKTPGLDITPGGDVIQTDPFWSEVISVYLKAIE